MSKIHKLRPLNPRLSPADASKQLRHVFVRDLELDASIGAYDQEKGRTQRIRINLDLSVDESGAGHGDSLDQVVCYDQLVAGVKSILREGHINLVETLAEAIGRFALEDVRVVSVRVRVEKLDAIPEASSVGVEIERRREES